MDLVDLTLEFHGHGISPDGFFESFFHQAGHIIIGRLMVIAAIFLVVPRCHGFVHQKVDV